MPLPSPSPRRHLHTRRIDLTGYVREDGNFDMEAHMVDTRSMTHARRDGSMREAGAPLHDMSLRMTISPEREIIACIATMDATPFSICPRAAANFSRLEGLSIEAGFLRRAMERVAGAEGCTHLRELLQQIGTVFVQTVYSAGKLTDEPVQEGGGRPPLLNTCYAWGDTNAMVAERFPAWHRESETV